MKRIAILAALAFASTAFAQQRPSDEEINARLQTIAVQRNTCQDQVAVLSGQAQAEIGKLRAEIDALKKTCGDACKPKEEPKK